jgi:translocator protein
MRNFEWYDSLIKPSFAPPAFLFGPVWSVLYLIIIVSFGFVFYKIYKGEFPKKLAVPLVINILSNALFTPLQFGLRSNLLAAVDIVVVLVTIVWIMEAVFPYKKWVSYAQIPYLLWVSFATILQFSVLFLNW